MPFSRRNWTRCARTFRWRVPTASGPRPWQTREVARNAPATRRKPVIRRRKPISCLPRRGFRKARFPHRFRELSGSAMSVSAHTSCQASGSSSWRRSIRSRSISVCRSSTPPSCASGRGYCFRPMPCRGPLSKAKSTRSIRLSTSTAVPYACAPRFLIPTAGCRPASSSGSVSSSTSGRMRCWCLNPPSFRWTERRWSIASWMAARCRRKS